MTKITELLKLVENVATEVHLDEIKKLMSSHDHAIIKEQIDDDRIYWYFENEIETEDEYDKLNDELREFSEFMDLDAEKRRLTLKF